MLVILTAANINDIRELTLFPSGYPDWTTPSWEQRKFSDVAVIRRGLTYSPTNIVDGADGVRVLRSANINEDHFVLNDDDVFVDEGAVNIDLVHDGDILITAANGSPRLVGKRARISDLPGKTVHGGFMLVASSPYSDFLCASMGSSWYRRFLATGVAGGNGAIGNLDSKALGETTIAVPNDAEIDKLGNFFTRLDSLITLHQRKCQYRGLYGYLSWEQRKLGELCELNPTAVLPDSFEYVDLESVAGTDMISHRREEKLTAPSRAQRLASFGDIFYQTVRPYQKNNYFYELPDEDYVFSTGYAQLRPLCDGRFLFSSLQRDQFVSCVLEHCTGTSYPAINANDLAALFLAVPIDAEEQRLVGSILKPIDSLITLHQ